jgi:Polymerase beta, Nucleotidyltransferase
VTPKQRDILNEVAAWADRFPCIKLMHVFGSGARGDDRESSDLDIAFEYVPDPDSDCYTNVNGQWGIFAADLKRKFAHQPKGTGLSPYNEPYDHVAWQSIREGREIGHVRKAVLTWTAPKPS